jgi:hypothetical protein
VILFNSFILIKAKFLGHSFFISSADNIKPITVIFDMVIVSYSKYSVHIALLCFSLRFSLIALNFSLKSIHLSILSVVLCTSLAISLIFSNDDSRLFLFHSTSVLFQVLSNFAIVNFLKFNT